MTGSGVWGPARFTGVWGTSKIDARPRAPGADSLIPRLRPLGDQSARPHGRCGTRCCRVARPSGELSGSQTRRARRLAYERGCAREPLFCALSAPSHLCATPLPRRNHQILERQMKQPGVPPPRDGPGGVPARRLSLPGGPRACPKALPSRAPAVSQLTSSRGKVGMPLAAPPEAQGAREARPEAALLRRLRSPARCRCWRVGQLRPQLAGEIWRPVPCLSVRLAGGSMRGRARYFTRCFT